MVNVELVIFHSVICCFFFACLFTNTAERVAPTPDPDILEHLEEKFAKMKAKSEAQRTHGQGVDAAIDDGEQATRTDITSTTRKEQPIEVKDSGLVSKRSTKPELKRMKYGRVV